MNFDSFRDSLSSYARTVERLRAFAVIAPAQEAPSPVRDEPLHQPIRLPKQDQERMEQLMDSFGLIHALCEQKKGVGPNQAGWNAYFLKTFSRSGDSLCASIRVFHEEPDRAKKATEALAKIHKKLKNFHRLSPRQQRRWNDTALDVLRRLVDAHKFLGQSKMQLIGCKADLLSKLSARLDVASKLNSRAGRGVRRLMGSFALEQRRVNHEFFQILEGLCSIHIKVRKFIRKQENQKFQQSACEIMNGMLALQRQQQESALRLAAIEHNQILLSGYLSSLHQESRQARR